MILKNLNVNEFIEELEKSAKDGFIGEEGNRSNIADSFNDGLTTMMYRACTMLIKKYGEQLDAERRISA